MMHPSRILLATITVALFAPKVNATEIRFVARKSVATGIVHTSRVAVGDFNGDGKPDLAISSTNNQVAVFLGKGGGAFSGPTVYTLIFNGTGSVAIGDFNNDGKLDLAVVGGDTAGNGLAFLAGNGDGTFGSPVYFKTTLSGASLTAKPADFNRDNNLDLFVGGNGNSEILLGDGKGGFTDGQLANASGFGIAIGDFNGDKKLDIASTQPYPYFSANGVSVLLGNGDGTIQAPQGYPGFESPAGIAIGNFNGDKKLDLVVSDYRFNTVVTLIGNGDGTFQNIGQWYAGLNPGSIAVADFNHDQKADLAVTDYTGNTITILPGKGDGSFPGSIFLTAGNGPSDIASVDLNADGSPDLVYVANLDNTFVVLLNAAGDSIHLASSQNPSQAGKPVTFTATFRATVDKTTTPTGKITFRDQASILAVVSLKNRTASFTTSSLNSGLHTIVASYSGDSHFNANKSNTVHQNVK